ncbi:AraC family transcriptional regulator [Actinomycetospora endophytica]|uniref:AraC family transcriptional regulator n=1 Tax=Actinomycetospora endophytica TaxID=2291215 RepID=A0ABS8PH29_9PSEU|nr:AraC family transcriptional regulator [Actinomycetospora endophytica]MCD2196299.1 AraC family transcriptional regulator [Actinomycetospora endophytica]
MLDVSAVSHAEVDTTDPEFAHQWISDTYTEHTPLLRGDRADFRMRVASLETDRFRIDDLVHTMSVETAVAPYQRLIVNRVRSGRYRMEMGGRSLSPGPGDLTVMDPLSAGWTTWDLLDVEVVALDLHAAQVVAGGLSGLMPERVRFHLDVPIDAAHEQYWNRTVDHMRRHVLADAELIAQPLVRAEAFRQLASAVVVVFPNNALDSLRDPTAPPAGNGEPAMVRRAVEFMDANAHRGIDISEIATAARIGPRGLQAAFRKHRGQSPLTYLRRVRLERAHRDLQAADPTRGDTVAAIAARWGFSHAGRFSILYQGQFGRPPSTTLRV